MFPSQSQKALPETARQQETIAIGIYEVDQAAKEAIV